MEEKRRNKRTKLSSKILIKALDGGSPREAFIEINDVSKNGIGFVSEEVLSIGAVYETYLTIWTKEVIHAFIRIVRIELVEDKLVYGAMFVGMPEMDAARIEVYQTVKENEE